MARETRKSSNPGGGRLARMRGAVAQTARMLAAKLRRGKAQQQEAPPQIARPAAAAPPSQHQARPRQPKTDVPLDLIRNAYTPRQTSLKASFRSDGADRQRDQEMPSGFADERWNEEDRFTNRSGDPRIGTHGRSHEPGEHRSGRNR